MNMGSLLKNRILKNLLFGFFIFIIFLMPVSLSLETRGEGALSFSITPELRVASAWLFGLSSITEDAFNNIFNWVGYAFLWVCALITRTAGMLLDASLSYTVFEMGEKLGKGSSLGGTVDNLWVLIRDICNLAFIFGLIYVGIRTIIDPESASTKRFLSRIIIGALLINFSLFFAKAIIDFSNFTAYQIYTSMVEGTGSISETIVQKLRIITFYEVADEKLTATAKDNSLAFFMMAGIFLLITAFVLFAGALILVSRFVVLIFIMIASPLLFAATVFPQTEHIATDIWKKLISQSFVAPIYILLVLISIKLIDGLGFSGSFAKEYSKEYLKSPSGSNLSATLSFTIIIFFMISALTIAKSMGGKGAEIAVSLANKVRGTVGRNTIGRASHWMREKYEHEEAKAANFKGDSSKGLAANARGYINKIGYGALNVTGADRGIRKGLEAGEHGKFGGAYSYEDDQKYEKDRKKRIASTNKLEEFKDAIKMGTSIDPATKKRVVLSPDEQIKFERAVADASVKDIEELTQEQRKMLIDVMTDSQLDALEKSEKLTDVEKGELGEARKELVKVMYTKDAESYKKLSKAGVGHLTTLGYEFLKEEQNAVQLTLAQMDELKKKLTATEYANINKVREDALKNLASGTSITATHKDGSSTVLNKSHITGRGPAEIAQMSTDVLVALGGDLPAPVLPQILKDGKKNQDEQKKIKQAIIAAAGAGMNVDAHEEFFNDNPIGKNFGK